MLERQIDKKTKQAGIRTIPVSTRLFFHVHLELIVCLCVICCFLGVLVALVIFLPLVFKIVLIADLCLSVVLVLGLHAPDESMHQ